MVVLLLHVFQTSTECQVLRVLTSTRSCFAEMRRGSRSPYELLLVLLLACTIGADIPTVSHLDSRAPHHAIETGTCEVPVTHHVTIASPSLCWTSPHADDSPTTTDPNEPFPATGAATTESLALEKDEDGGSMADAAGPPFMSFEDWKEEMLKRTGQDPQDLRSRKVNGGPKAAERDLTDDTGPVWGDEEEIALDFGQYARAQDQHHDGGEEKTDRQGEQQRQDSAIAYDHGKGFLHRSKDAGKTCKERFSYSSFDAGATILKTGSGTKNSKAILVENKDSYMLLECGRDNKFVIIELSDDILLDTVVIANFEFFSSMIRHFRISVSDRYPVKVDKWKELGTFEARNSRDIQAFLVENPQIWAKYVRIEFLTHFGNEYYCPVSLVRIHGTRMLDSWKEADGTPGDEASDDGERVALQCEESTLEQQVSSATETRTAEESISTSSETRNSATTMTSMDLFAIFAATCPSLPTQLALMETTTSIHDATRTDTERTPMSHQTVSSSVDPVPSHIDVTESKESAVEFASTNGTSADYSPTEQLRNASTISATSEKPLSDQKSSEHPSTKSTQPGQPGQASKPAQSGSPSARSRGTPSGNAAAASPTVQEGFFNSITKRLVQVESNLTLSMQYIEDQSRHVQEAMQRMEQKQSQRITHALDSLNTTVLSELRTIRDQYEQLWQQTIHALENQKEQTEQDAVALSARLNLLADEVVFQKRMAIAQAVLLLSCLFLVIFSRGVPLPYLAPPQHSNEALGYAPPRLHARTAQRHATSQDTSATPQLQSIRHTIPEVEIGTRHADDADFRVSTLSAQDSPNSQYHASHARYYRPSPPLTPRTHVEDDFNFHEVSGEGLSSRLPASDQHNSRKPLPALPEHPLSP